jgi:hypothetical protein
MHPISVGTKKWKKYYQLFRGILFHDFCQIHGQLFEIQEFNKLVS